MGYVITGLVIFVLLALLGRGLKLPTWRIGSAVAAIGAFAAAGYFAIRGAWPIAVTLGVIGIWLAVSARMPRGPAARSRPRMQQQQQQQRRPLPREQMSIQQACQILGVKEDATVQEIQVAYKRLMIRVHPDNGGAPGLAVQLNAARDRLLKGPRP